MRYQINKTKFLNEHELSEIRSSLDNSRDALIIKLALETGARAQELLNISKTDLDDVNQSVFIRGLKNSMDREIPLTKDLFDALKGLTLSSDAEKVFPICYSRLNAIWTKYKLGGKSFKSLRHTAAIELYRKTKDLRLVKVFLGHVSILNTMVYADYVYQTEEMRKLLNR